MGTLLFPFFFNRSIQYGCLFVLCVYIIIEQWRRKGDYIKCELIGGVSPRHLNTFSKPFSKLFSKLFLLLAVHHPY